MNARDDLNASTAFDAAWESENDNRLTPENEPDEPELYCWMCCGTLTREEKAHCKPADPDSIICRFCAVGPSDF